MIGIINQQTKKYSDQAKVLNAVTFLLNCESLAINVQTAVFTAANTSNVFEQFRCLAKAANFVHEFRLKYERPKRSFTFESGGYTAPESMAKLNQQFHIQREEFIFNIEKRNIIDPK